MSQSNSALHFNMLKKELHLCGFCFLYGNLRKYFTSSVNYFYVVCRLYKGSFKSMPHRNHRTSNINNQFFSKE